MKGPLALAAVAAACTACASRPSPRPASAATVRSEPAPAWMNIASADTMREIDTLPARFAAARHALPRRLAARAVAEGPLLDASVAEPAPELPPGPYHCRLFRLGGRAGLRSFAPDLCHVIPGPDRGIAFTKAEGANLIDGYLYADSPRRLILIGAARRTGTPGKGRYGDDPAQDVAGIVERVSAFRWRLSLTRASGEAAIDLYELVPVTPLVPGARAMVPVG